MNAQPLVLSLVLMKPLSWHNFARRLQMAGLLPTASDGTQRCQQTTAART